MNNIIEEAAELSLDRSGWLLVKFGDIAIQQKKTVNRENTDLTRYVKGEHMYSEDIHLREWGELKDEYLGPAFIRKFETGDILYGSRRTYLRKVVVAPFEGITSNTTFVIKANESVINKKLLPYIMLSEGFSQHSIKNSKGSVNPYVNWKDLANYELLIPPREMQQKYVDLLELMDSSLQSDIKLQSKASLAYETAKSTLMLRGMGGECTISEKLKVEVNKDWREVTLGGLIDQGSIVKVQDGNHGELHPKSSDYVENGIPFVMANTLCDGGIDFNKAKFLPRSITDKLRIGFATSGDVLISHKGTVGEVAIVPDIRDFPYLMLTPQVTLYRCDKELLSNKFLYYAFTSDYFQRQLRQLSSQSTRAYVGITSQRKLRVVLPNNFSEQVQIVEALESAKRNLKNINSKIDHSKNFFKSLINQVF